MPWARLSDNFFAHPKVIAAGLDGAGLFAFALSYSACYLTDGVVPRRWVLGLVGGELTLPDRLCKLRLWRERGDSYVIPDWADYNMTRAEYEEEKAKKSAAGRKSAEARRSAGA